MSHSSQCQVHRNNAGRINKCPIFIFLDRNDATSASGTDGFHKEAPVLAPAIAQLDDLIISSRRQLYSRFLPCKDISDKCNS